MTTKRQSFRWAAAAILAGAAALAAACGPGASDQSAPDSSLSRFAKGELAKLEVLPDPPAQPDIVFLDGQGAQRTLADFRGKVVVVNLWATWCVPCIKELPSLDRLQAARGSDRFQVVALSVDRGLDDARDYLQQKGVSNLALYQESSMAMATRLGVDGIPVTVIYDPEGRELARLAGGAEWDSPEALALVDAATAAAFPAG